MSSFKSPVGPQPSKVYWRRRVGVIGALLLVVLVIVLIAVKPGAGSEAAPAPVDSSSPPVAAAPGTATPAPAASVKPVAPPTSAATAACSAADIELKPIVNRSNYSSLQQPQISMSITNSSTSPCTIDLGSSQQTLTIKSGAETYWSSKDCQVNGTHQTVKLAAGQTLKTPAIAWDRTRSSTSTCDTTRNSVPAGGASYHLSVAVGSITSATSALMVLN